MDLKQSLKVSSHRLKGKGTEMSGVAIVHSVTVN